MANYDYRYATGWQSEFEGPDGILAKINAHTKAAAFLSYGIPGTIYVQSQPINYPSGPAPSDFMYGYVPDVLAANITFSASGLNSVDQVLAVRPVASQSATAVNFNLAGASLTLGTDRIIFHELVHGLIAQGSHKSWGFSDADGRTLNMSETIAVLAENLFYATDTSQYRLGHANYDSKFHIVHGPVGLEMFAGQAMPSIAFGLGTTSLVSSNTGYSISKTYFEVGNFVGLYRYANYVTDHIDYANGSGLVQKSGGTSSITSAAGGILTNIMSPASPGSTISVALSVLDAMDLLKPGFYTHAYGALIGIDRNQILDASSKVGSTVHDPVDITGPVAFGTFDTPGKIGLEASAGVGTIIIGASGFQAGQSTYVGGVVLGGHDASHSVDFLVGATASDILIAGTGASAGRYNALNGMTGDDILIGGTADDMLDGGADNDILVASAGDDSLNGGGGFDVAYYAKLTAGISFGPDGVTKSNGTDTLTDIDTVIGTQLADRFFAFGSGMTFIGNGGNDRFYAADGADTFVGKYASGSGTINSLDFGALTSGVDLHVSDPTKIGTGMTVAGHVFSGVTSIVGSAYQDAFEINAATDRITVRGGNEIDRFTLSGCVTAFGDGGDDYFSIGSQWYGQIIVDGGAGSNTLDLVAMRTDYPGGGSVKIQINLAAHTVGAFNPSVGGSLQTMNYSNIDTFVLGTQITDITGTSGVDQIRSGTGGGTIHGNGGGDILYGSIPLSASKVINLYGDAGDDTFFLDGAANAYGGADNDHIFGSSQRDIITGEAGNDEIRAGDGYDLIMGMVGTDTVDGGDRIDLFRVAAAGDTSATTFSFTLGGVDGPAFRVVTGSDSVTLTNVEHIYFDKPNSYVADFNFDIGEAIAAMTADGVTSMTGDVLEASLKAHHYATRAYWQQPLQDAHRGAAAASTFGDSVEGDSADPLLDAYDWGAYFGTGSTAASDQPSDQMFFVHDDRSLIGTVPDQYPGRTFAADMPPFNAESARGTALLAQAIAFEGGAGVGDMGYHLGQDADAMGFLAAHYMTPIHQDMLIL